MTHPLSERITSLILNSPMPLDGLVLKQSIRALMQEYSQDSENISDTEILQLVTQTLEMLKLDDESYQTDIPFDI